MNAAEAEKALELPMNTDLSDAAIEAEFEAFTLKNPTTQWCNVWRQWIAVEENYCGAPDSGCPVGMGTTEDEALADLKESIWERDCTGDQYQPAKQPRTET